MQLSKRAKKAQYVTATKQKKAYLIDALKKNKTVK